MYICVQAGGIQPTSIVTMVMKVLHNIYNMCSGDLPDMYALAPQAQGLVHTYVSGKSLAVDKNELLLHYS